MYVYDSNMNPRSADVVYKVVLIKVTQWPNTEVVAETPLRRVFVDGNRLVEEAIQVPDTECPAPGEDRVVNNLYLQVWFGFPPTPDQKTEARVYYVVAKPQYRVDLVSIGGHRIDPGRDTYEVPPTFQVVARLVDLSGSNVPMSGTVQLSCTSQAGKTYTASLDVSGFGTDNTPVQEVSLTLQNVDEDTYSCVISSKLSATHPDGSPMVTQELQTSLPTIVVRRKAYTEVAGPLTPPVTHQLLMMVLDEDRRRVAMYIPRSINMITMLEILEEVNLAINITDIEVS